MKNHYKIVSCFVLVIFCGCSSYEVSDITNYHKMRADTWHNDGFGVEMINPQTYKPASSSKPLYELAIDSAHPDDAKVARNRLQTVMMTLSDKAVSKHLSRVTGTQVDVNVILGGAALAFSGAASVGSPQAAKAFAATATGVLGMKGLFNEEVYKNALVQTLVGAIISDRNLVKANIKISQSESIADYPVDSAVADVLDLHNRGSFYYGLTLIRQSAEAANLARQTAADPTNVVQRATDLATKKKALKAVKAAP